MTSYKKMILRNTLSICLLFSLLFTLSLYAEQYISFKKEYSEKALQNTDDIMDRLNAASAQLCDLSLLFQENEDLKTYVENADAPVYTRKTFNSYLYDIISSLSTINGLVSIARFSDDRIITHKSIMNRAYFYQS